MPRCNKKEKEYLLGIEPKYLLSEPDWKNIKRTDPPEGYPDWLTWLQYIQNAGNSYIDFSWVMRAMTRIEATFEGVSSNTTLITDDRGENDTIYLYFQNNVLNFTTGRDSGSDNISPTSKFKFTYDSTQGLWCVNDSCHPIAAHNVVGSTSLRIFNGNGFPKLHELNITLGGTSYQIYPSIVNDESSGYSVGTVGLYCIGTSQFFTNNVGEIIPGPRM